MVDRRGSTWVFGYGSLIYKTGFDFLRCERAAVRGWQRRFWQGSHDHRGTPEAPGRVVTLVPAARAVCTGIAYLVEPAVFDYLDHREKNGYRRQPVEIALTDTGEVCAGVTYIAQEGNPAYLGPAPMEELARHIAASRGPSGSNMDYVLELAESLEAMGERDEHVSELARRLKEFSRPV